MAQIKAIPTLYKNTTFRSRLEARWAVFFDFMQVPWEYEPEGYYLEDGSKYLPDFFLPERNIFVEIKPSYPGDSYIKKLERFTDDVGAILLVVGTPGSEHMTLFCFDIGDSSAGYYRTMAEWAITHTNLCVLAVHDSKLLRGDRELFRDLELSSEKLNWILAHGNTDINERDEGWTDRAYRAANKYYFKGPEDAENESNKA